MWLGVTCAVIGEHGWGWPMLLSVCQLLLGWGYGMVVVNNLQLSTCIWMEGTRVQGMWYGHGVMFWSCNNSFVSLYDGLGGGAGSHGCGRPVMLSLNVLIFCFYYGLEWYSYVWRWPVLRYLHDLLVKWSTMMTVWSKALPKVPLNPGRGMLESCQWLGVRQWFPLDATVYATCHSWQTMTAIL